MVVFCLIMYTLMGWIPADSVASSTYGSSHSLPALHFAVIPVIRCTERWWNDVSTLSISQATTQLLLLYNSTDCAMALYITPRACIVAPILSSTLDIMPHRLQALRRFRYTNVQSLLL